MLKRGTLGTAVGPNPAYTQASQQASTRTSTLYQQATSAYSAAVKDYQQASKIHPRNTTYLQELASAAANSGNSKVAVAALRKYLKVDPHSPLAPQIRKEIAALAPSTPQIHAGNG